MLAADAHLDDLVVIVDRNDAPKEAAPACVFTRLEPLAARWEGFGSNGTAGPRP